MCQSCEHVGHKEQGSWENPKNANECPKGYHTQSECNTSKKSTGNNELLFSGQQFSHLVNQLPMFSKKSTGKKKKRKVKADSDGEDEKAHFLQKLSSGATSDTDGSEYSHNINEVTSNKRHKKTHSSTEVVVELQDRHVEVRPI